MRRGFFALLFALQAPSAFAQDEQPQSRVTESREPGEAEATAITVLLWPAEATIAQSSLVEATIALRRRLEAGPFRYVHPVDMLSDTSPPEELADVAAELDSLARSLRETSTPNPRRARGHVERADALVRKLEAHLLFAKRSALVDAYFLAAIAGCARGDSLACSAGFARIVVFREDAVYDVERYPEVYLDRFEEARRSVLNGPRGSVEITAEPEGTEVFVDGRSRGVVPALVEGLAVGTHFVTLKAVGYEKVISPVVVSPDAPAVLNEVLVPTARARILSDQLPRIEAEFGTDRVGSFTMGVAGYLFVREVLVGRVSRSDDERLIADLIFYDLRTSRQLARSDVAFRRRGGSLVLEDDSIGALLETRARALTLPVSQSSAANVLLSSNPAEPSDTPAAALHEKWWFWTAIGAAVAGAAVTTYLLVSSGADDSDTLSVHGSF